MARLQRCPSDCVTCKHCGKEYRAISVLHLRNIHGYDGDHPILAYLRKFRLQTATCRDARKKISEAKVVFWGKRGQHWTRAKLLGEINRVHRSGRSLRRQRISVRLYEAGRRYFGTWQAAVEKVGLNYDEATGVTRWTREKVVEAIKELAKRGETLTAKYVEAHHPRLFRAAVKRFPRSWAKALRAAGLDPHQHKAPRGQWNNQKAAEWVRKRVANGKPILARDAPPRLVDFVHRCLDIGWTDFVESLGIPYPGIKKRRDWSRAKVLSEIRRCKTEGYRMNHAGIKGRYQALLHQAKKHFGSWDLARAAARV